MHRVSFPLEPRAESPSISEESSVQKFPPSLSQFEFRPSCDTFFFLYISRAKNSIRRFYQTRILSSAIDPTNHFQFSLYLGYKYDVPSLLLSHFLIPPSPFFLYLSVIPKTDSFQWKKIGKESPQRYEGQGSRRIRGQEFFRRELRRWRKFGHANGKSFGWDRGIIGSTGWSEAADNYTDRRVDDGAARIEDLEGTPLLFSYTVSVSLFLFLASTVSTAGGNVFHRVVKLLTTYLSRIRVARSWNHRFVGCRIKKYIT